MHFTSTEFEPEVFTFTPTYRGPEPRHPGGLGSVRTVTFFPAPQTGKPSPQIQPFLSVILPPKPLESDATSAPKFPARARCCRIWVCSVAIMSSLSGTDADEDFGVPSGNFPSCDCHATTGRCHTVTVGQLGENPRTGWILDGMTCLRECSSDLSTCETIVGWMIRNSG